MGRNACRSSQRKDECIQRRPYVSFSWLRLLDNTYHNNPVYFTLSPSVGQEFLGLSPSIQVYVTLNSFYIPWFDIVPEPWDHHEVIRIIIRSLILSPLTTIFCFVSAVESTSHDEDMSDHHFDHWSDIATTCGICDITCIFSAIVIGQECVAAVQ